MGNIKRNYQITKEFTIFRREMPKNSSDSLYIGPFILCRKCNTSPQKYVQVQKKIIYSLQLYLKQATVVRNVNKSYTIKHFTMQRSKKRKLRKLFTEKVKHLVK